MIVVCVKKKYNCVFHAHFRLRPEGYVGALGEGEIALPPKGP